MLSENSSRKSMISLWEKKKMATAACSLSQPEMQAAITSEMMTAERLAETMVRTRAGDNFFINERRCLKVQPMPLYFPQSIYLKRRKRKLHKKHTLKHRVDEFTP